MLVGDDRKYLYDYLSEVVGIPVYTHEIPHIVDVYKNEIKRDFVKICKSISDADVQEIVRCRDCKFNGYCSVQDYVMFKDDNYCSRGIRTDGEENENV